MPPPPPHPPNGNQQACADGRQREGLLRGAPVGGDVLSKVQRHAAQERPRRLASGVGPQRRQGQLLGEEGAKAALAHGSGILHRRSGAKWVLAQQWKGVSWAH